MKPNQKKIKELKAVRTQLEKVHSCPIAGPLTLGEEFVFFRKTPTGTSWKQFQIEIGREVMRSQQGGLADLSTATENLVIKNILGLDRMAAKTLFDASPWGYTKVSEVLQKSADAPMIDLDADFTDPKS